MFDRLELLIGKDSLSKIKEKNVVVLGLGGVGGYVVEALVRSGIENITIIDNDAVDITNLNRQIIANLNNIGKLKTDEFEKRILSINNRVKVKKISSFIDSVNIDSIFKDKIDYFIDACDTVSTKKLVIENCIKNNIKFITCLGTGKRLDPSKLTICDIRDTKNDPIARILRKYVKDSNIKDKVICCYSEEEPLKCEGKKIGSTAFVPSSAGLLIASYIIKDIIK
ncbi:MAG: ThiF family adenylyltransferase [Bacilli bacterium]|nr:ThiF family adenylyltransferase [Bacilli bacterium]